MVNRREGSRIKIQWLMNAFVWTEGLKGELEAVSARTCRDEVGSDSTHSIEGMTSLFLSITKF